MKKTYLSMVIVLSVLLSIFLNLNLAYGEISLSITNKTANPGSTVSVPVVLANNNSVVSLQFDILFNSSDLGIDNVSKPVVSGDALQGTNFNVSSKLIESGRIRVIITPPIESPLPVIPNGTIVTIPIKVNPNITNDNETLEFDKVSASDANGSSVSIDTSKGTLSIQISRPHPNLSYTFTPGNDTNYIQNKNLSILDAGKGDDTYIIDPQYMTDDLKVTVIDYQGNNIIRIPNGTNFKEIKVAKNAIEFILENGAVVKVLDADHFHFQLGGDESTGEGSTDQTFEEFVTDSLKLAQVPQDNEHIADVKGEISVVNGSLNIGSGSDTGENSIKISNFKITSNTYSINDNLSKDCQDSFGEGWRLADWNELVKFYNNGGDLESLLDYLGIKYYPDKLGGDAAFVSVNGKGFYNGSLHYYIARHDHETSFLCQYGGWPNGGCFAEYDQLDNHLISLGAWDSNKKILCFNPNSSS